ncbi:MAG: DHH family phosphoesterase, partial [Thermoplasmata archaeon]|nr:DHH family phosphoesterase [Thermoplasmata archaeon]
MKRTASRLAGRIRKSKEVLVAAHIDADGISAAGVASKALERVGIEHRARFFKSLDDDAISSIADENSELTWLVDFGSGEVNKLGGLNAVITDHHASPQAEVPLGKRTNLLEFLDSLGSQDAPGKENNTLTLNPHDFGKDGATDVSGAGVTYLVAKALDKKNTDLAALAVVGAVGDLQDV